MSVICAACGAPQGDDARFCSDCGASLRRACGACGAEQAVSAAFCSSCGAALDRDVQAPGRDERRLVTVLFADLAGSTAFAERVDPEDVRSILGDFAKLVDDEVGRHGGMLEKFIGDAAMAVFGVPQAHEDDAERAVRAALAVSARFPELADRVARSHGVELGVRIGVNTGEVVAGPGAYAGGELVVSGDPVNVAARLEQHAEPGTVLVGDRTRAAAERAIEFRAREPIEAKGKDAPVVAWEAVAVRGAARRRGLDGHESPLVGREQELALLGTLAARVELERMPQLVTLFGAAGVGKSRLLREFVSRIGHARLLSGRCVPYGEGITYRPLADIAKDHAGILETDSAAEALGKLEAAVGSVLPGDRHSVAAIATTIGLGSAETEGDRRTWLHDAWARYLTALGRERLTIVAIEDIHWASDPLLDALDHLAEALVDTSVLLVLPTRPELLEERTTWGAGRQNATSLTVPPLQPDQTAALVEALIGSGLPDELREAVLARAEGNPFYVEEILRMLIERGALRRRNGGWETVGGVDAVEIPDSVHGVISARLDALEPDAREALRRCAVVGRVFWPEAVEVAADAVVPLVRRGLVQEQATSSVEGSREFAFKHALTQEVAYATLPRPERRELHRGVADWILRVAPDRVSETAELAAYHLTEAIAYGDDDPAVRRRAFDLLLQAGETALRRGAGDPAERLFSRALELGIEEKRASALFGLGRALVSADRVEHAHATFAEVRELAEHSHERALLGDVLGWSSRTSWLLGEWAGALETAESAVEVLRGLGETREYARALARRSQIAMLREWDEAGELAAEAVGVAQRVGDGFAEVNARINLFTARANAGAPADAEEMRACVDKAVESGSPEEAYRALINWIWQAHAHAPLSDVLEEARRLLVELEGSPAIESYLALSIARLLALPLGRWDDVDATLARPMQDAASTSLLRMDLEVGMAIRRGRLEAADRLLPELRRTALASGEPQRVAPMYALAFARAAVDEDAAALAGLTDELLAFGPRLWVPTFSSAVIPRALGRHAPLLRRLAAELEALPPKRRHWRCAVAIDVAGALVDLADGNSDGAVARLDAVVASERALGRDYDVACLELDLARALDAAGRGGEARETREHAAAFLASLGCVNPY